MKADVNSNYLIHGIEVLLHEDRILKCYVPLIPLKHQLVQGLLNLGYKTRDDCLALSDEALTAAGLPADPTGLFRRFLMLYDYKGKGIRDISDAESRSEDEIASLLELMRLPGVKLIRAQLYYHCGLRSLADFAAADAEALQSAYRRRDCQGRSALLHAAPQGAAHADRRGKAVHRIRRIKQEPGCTFACTLVLLHFCRRH